MGAGRFIPLFLSVRALVALVASSAPLAGCNGLFYFPYRGVYALPEGPHRDVSIPTEDGFALHGWLLPARGEQRGTVVQFHGNAGNVTSHFLSLGWVTGHGLALLSFDYRGYGRSPGSPSPEGLDRDARAAIRFAHTLPRGAWASDLVLVGQSLGGAVLLSTYGRLPTDGRERVRAIVVEGTFHSYSEIAASVLWRTGLFLPFAGFGYALVSDAYAPAPYIARVAPTPLLVVHGDRDRVVPIAFGRAVFDLSAEPRRFWSVRGAGHLRAFASDREQERLIAYLESL
jgi:fermentation-respiration switch protein FrsA (DUF1100 family)